MKGTLVWFYRILVEQVREKGTAGIPVFSSTCLTHSATNGPYLGYQCFDPGVEIMTYHACIIPER